MTRNELKDRIMNVCYDPYTDGDQEIVSLTIEEAEKYLPEILSAQNEMDLDQDERIPEDLAPAMLMELWNEIAAEHNAEIRKEKTIDRLSEYIRDNCMIAEYDSFRYDYFKLHGVILKEVAPMEWLDTEDDPFELDVLPITEMIDLVRHSPKFNTDHNYYTLMDGKLISTNNPFYDGLIESIPMAIYMVEHDEDYGLSDIRAILDGKEVPDDDN